MKQLQIFEGFTPSKRMLDLAKPAAVEAVKDGELLDLATGDVVQITYRAVVGHWTGGHDFKSIKSTDAFLDQIGIKPDELTYHTSAIPGTVEIGTVSKRSAVEATWERHVAS